MHDLANDIVNGMKSEQAHHEDQGRNLPRQIGGSQRPRAFDWIVVDVSIEVDPPLIQSGLRSGIGLQSDQNTSPSNSAAQSLA